MKPQNKLNGKLDKIKSKVAFESSKKVSEIARVKEQNKELADDNVKHKVKIITKERDEALLKVQVIEQSLRSSMESTRQLAMKHGNIIVKLKKALIFYKDGKHYEKVRFGDKVIDRGEVATEALSDK